MSTLRGLTPKDTFGDLLHVSNGGLGADQTKRQVVDGAGNSVPMRVSVGDVALDKVSSYKMSLVETTGLIDLDASNVFKINATSDRTVTFANTPGATTFMTIVVVVSGNTGSITWPAGIIWDSNTAPKLGTNKTIVTLAWDGTSWIGTTGAKA